MKALMTVLLVGSVVTCSLQPARVAASHNPLAFPAQEGDKLVYADFENVKDNQPLSNRGGAVRLYGYQESPSSPSKFKGSAAHADMPELVRLNKDDPNRAAAFDYELQPPNQWAGAGLEVFGLPDKDGKPAADDVTHFKFLTLQIYVTGVQSVTVEFLSRGQGLTIEQGPQMTFKVTKGFNTYRVPLDQISQPAWVENKVSPKEVLKRLTAIHVQVSCNQCPPTKGTMVVDNLVFQK